jgi:hypothetical protein
MTDNTVNQSRPPNQVFYSTSENARLTYIWIILSVHALVKIMEKKLHLTNLRRYTILQIARVSRFENNPLSARTSGFHKIEHYT